jgi:predicted RNA-binding Zn ribbon-like protein
VHLNPYGEDPVRLAVELVADPPRTASELAERCTAAGVVLESAPARTDLAELEAFLVRWLEVVDATSLSRRAELLNGLLAESAWYPRLTNHTGEGWHLHYRPDVLPLGLQVRSLICVGTALHLTGRGLDRLGRCALEECGNAFADFTRGGRQRYCSHTCANRDAVRRHRAKAS